MLSVNHKNVSFSWHKIPQNNTRDYLSDYLSLCLPVVLICFIISDAFLPIVFLIR